MTTKRTGLGRGLDALLGDVKITSADERSDGAASAGSREIPVDLLQRGAFQPRQDMRQESLQDLAASIRAQGLIQPIVVRPLASPDSSGARRYEIVAGERRWRAAQLAGLDTVPVMIRQIPDSAAIAVALIENIQRENLSPLEEAEALRRLIDEFELTHEAAAKAIGRSRTAVSNLLRLLDLGDAVKSLVQARDLEMGHARALLGLADSHMQAEVASLVAKKGLSVRQTEQLVKRVLAGDDKTRDAGSAAMDPDVRRLQDELAERLGARVIIKHGTKGRGKLVISYNSVDELEGILEHIK